MMNKSLLTFDLLRRFEKEYVIDNYTEEQQRTIEIAARAAMFNRHWHYEHGEEWTENDIFNDFLRILKYEKVDTKK